MTLTSVRKLALLLLFMSAIFEPSDLVFGLKAPLFILFCLTGVLAFFLDENFAKPSFPQLLYVFTFSLLLPMWGLAIAVVFNPGTMGTDGLQYFKSHLFLIFSLFLTPVALLNFGERAFIILLDILAHVIIGLFVISLVLPTPLFGALAVFGRQHTLFLLGAREYAGVHFPTMYYVTSPLLVFSLAYYLERASKKADGRTLYLVLVSFIALFLSGTRNNILISFLIPAYYFLFRPRGRVVLALSVPVVIAVSINVLQSMFDPNDVSNAAKIAYLADYSAILSVPVNLLIGQGLGTRFFATGLGEVVSITELSYFEIVRTYGVVVGMIFFVYLIYPLILLFRTRERRYFFTVGFAAYLIESYSNPYLLSSNGMLVLGLVAAFAFQPKRLHESAAT